MIKKEKVMQIMNEIAPLDLAENWDNVGMIVDVNDDIAGIMVVLDITKSIIEEAKEKGVNLIISHHPVMFSAIKSIGKDDIVYLAIKNGISIYSAHTNMDLASDGLNQMLAKLIGLDKIKLMSLGDDEYAFGRIGKLEKAISLKDFALKIKEVLDISSLRVMGDKDKEINLVAVSCGSGSNFIGIADKLGADLIITSEIKHNLYMDNIDSGICAIDAGHYDTEKHFVDVLIKRLNKYFYKCNDKIDILKSESDIRPYWTI